MFWHRFRIFTEFPCRLCKLSLDIWRHLHFEKGDETFSDEQTNGHFRSSFKIHIWGLTHVCHEPLLHSAAALCRMILIPMMRELVLLATTLFYEILSTKVIHYHSSSKVIHYLKRCTLRDREPLQSEVAAGLRLGWDVRLKYCTTYNEHKNCGLKDYNRYSINHA